MLCVKYIKSKRRIIASARKSVYRLDESPIHPESSNSYFSGRKEENILSPLSWFSKVVFLSWSTYNLFPIHSDLTQVLAEEFCSPPLAPLKVAMLKLVEGNQHINK